MKDNNRWQWLNAIKDCNAWLKGMIIVLTRLRFFVSQDKCSKSSRCDISRAGCLETCIGLETRLETRFCVSRPRYANVSSRSRTLKVSENGHASIEAWKNFGFETAFRSLIRKQQWYLPDVFKVKHCAWFCTLQKQLATFCLDHFALLFRLAELQAFAFFLWAACMKTGLFQPLSTCIRW